MSPATATLALAPPLSLAASSEARPPRRTTTVRANKKQTQGVVGFGGGKKETSWNCVEGCGACCKLQKGPSFLAPEEIFTDPSHVEQYKSLIGPDGWCIHYEKSTRKCSIYSERPYFCRVQPEVFKSLYEIKEKRFNQEACRFCQDTIKSIYGSNSKELSNFNKSVRSSSS
ncbi:uncharacterized protein LOC130721206 [Lotus japonicus]|uniref:uncharacterized protein LOC130721206 n=1 Tax=Lotus japonicus TaxID=34305 RepID=UPI00258801AB|nr:uncharacterized protein LOC130721206 [Lotus japonicus]XP_057427946.1 uncharacterized protein LOC130721206 [Lotus japonicus]XP_057427947.1 uncharacterized protein LOC130721206 [Lotus japonicus]